MSTPRGIPVGCGIDYGSSNSAVALAYPDGVEVVGEARDDALAPSTLYLHRDGRRVAGNRASELFFRTGHQRTICASCSLARYGVSDCRQFRRAGSCNDSRLLWSVKRDLANLGFAGTNSWATDFPVVDLVAVTLHLLRRRAERMCDEEVTRVVLGPSVKQLLLRVPDDVHRRLAARAAREGRSVNAVATELLDVSAEVDQGDRRARLRAKAAAEGFLANVAAPAVSAARRAEIIKSTRGLGPIADDLIAYERDRL